MGNEALRAPNGSLIRVPVVLYQAELGWGERHKSSDGMKCRLGQTQKSRELSIENPPGYRHHLQVLLTIGCSSSSTGSDESLSTIPVNEALLTRGPCKWGNQRRSLVC